MKQPQHIPTLVALLLLLVGLSSTIFLVENATRFFSQASESMLPQEVTVTNITDTSFTINWLTEKPSSSFVRIYSKELIPAEILSYDVRDTAETRKSRTIHSVTVQGLEPNNSYTYEIISGKKTYTDEKFLATTGPELGAPQHIQDPAHGTLLTKTNVPVDEAIVYASFEGSQTLSSLVSNGAWMIPLGAIRSQDTSRYFIPRKNDQERIFFVANTDTSTVTTTIDNDSPLPEVQLGTSYDFMQIDQRQSSLIIAQAENRPTNTAAVNTSSGFQITSPAKGLGVPSRLPTFKGTGFSNKQVILTISGNNKPPITTKVTVNKNNLWEWTPTDSLLPGTYTVSAASFDEKNRPLVLSQEFTILKSGSQVLQAATPSATFKPSAIPTPTLRPSASLVATASPVPVTGTATPTLFIALGAVLFIIIGFAL